MTETASAGEPRYMRSLDWVDFDVLPRLEHIPPTGDTGPLFKMLDPFAGDTPQRFVPGKVVERLTPAEHITTLENVGVDFELLASEARSQAAPRFRHIIRMGGSFDHLRDHRTPRQLEAQAVETVGLDASLYFHGVEQLRRANQMVTMQQLAHRYVFEDVMSAYLPTRRAVEILDALPKVIPVFTPQDAKKLFICAKIHDYGEARKRRDVPLEEKLDPAYVFEEAAECVQLANELHVPKGSPHLMTLLDKRVEQEQGNINFEDKDRHLVVAYLAPREINAATYGTEQQHYKRVIRGHGFAGIERQEYILEGIRSDEAVEHDFQDVRRDEKLHRNLSRLGVSTFFLSLQVVMEHAERYVSVYDFLRQNTGRIDYYIDVVTEDIADRRQGRIDDDRGFFGIDPFVNYATQPKESERISHEEAKDRFLEAAEAWKQWQRKGFLARVIWETYFGNTHPQTRDNPDVSFLQRTAQNIDGSDGPQVPVAKCLEDMWGVGLDLESQRLHEAKSYDFITSN